MDKKQNNTISNHSTRWVSESWNIEGLIDDTKSLNYCQKMYLIKYNMFLVKDISEI